MTKNVHNSSRVVLGIVLKADAQRSSSNVALPLSKKLHSTSYRIDGINLQLRIIEHICRRGDRSTLLVYGYPGRTRRTGNIIIISLKSPLSVSIVIKITYKVSFSKIPSFENLLGI